MDRSRRLLLLGALGTLLCGAAAARAKPRVIKIVAKKFAYVPNRIMLKAGEPVVLEFTALDFVHGMNLPDFHIRADLVPGQPTRVALTPPSAGKFTFLCDNFCGDGHEQMNGELVVT
ncbi:MAG: cupredoxin domain-containing protein [Pseudomonadota bacterium]